VPDPPNENAFVPGENAAPATLPGGASAVSPSWRQRRRAKKARRSKFRRWTTRGVLALILCLVIFVGAVVGFTIYRIDQIGRVKVIGLNKVRGGIENILLVGSTSRCAIEQSSKFERFRKECLEGINGVNSDVIMILRLNPNDHRVSLLSIPRDTFVPDARVIPPGTPAPKIGAGGFYNKVDAALADGPDQLVRAIEEDLGIPINHYVVLNFGSFTNIVDALGGLDMYFPTQLKDMDGLLQTKTGCQHINGTEALEIVRARHLYYQYDYKTKAWRDYDGSGDLGRIERVHIFLRVLADSVKRRGLGDLATDESLLAAVAPQLTVDTTLGDEEMLDLLRDFHSVSVGAVPEYTVPIVVDTQSYMYKGFGYGDVVFPTEPQDEQTIDAFMGTSPPGLKLHSSGITVSVVDGTGSARATAAVASELRALGYRVIASGAQTPVGPISETTVVYGTGHLQQAEKVLSDVSGTVSLGHGATLGGADVTVVTGSDLAVASAHPVHASSPAHGSRSARKSSPAKTTSTTTTTTTPGTDGGVLGSPTAATRSIPPYDPRACPTSKTG
jgi:LCP family protein required for cell wall assembly